MKHELKIWPSFFQASLDGKKNFEIRRNDRSFHVGDSVVLREYDPHSDSYSGREIVGEITYVTDWYQQPGVVVFGYRPKEPSCSCGSTDVRLSITRGFYCPNCDKAVPSDPVDNQAQPDGGKGERE